MQPYVIGVFCTFDEASAAALDLKGNLLGCAKGKSCSYTTAGRAAAQRRAAELIDRVITSFQGAREDCRCLFVGSVGVDSPKTREEVTECFAAARMVCPLICLNDGVVAHYTTTHGVGVLTVASRGSIAVGRDAQGKMTRSGGHPLSVLGEEGSLQWITLHAMHLVTQWLDGSVEKTPLLEKIDRYFDGLDIEKMTEWARSIKPRSMDMKIARLVMEAAQEGDEAAALILRRGAAELFSVAQTCVRKLGFTPQDHFLSGVWGEVFEKSPLYLEEFRRLFAQAYPNSRIVFPERDAAESTALMALDFIQGRIPYNLP